MKTIIKGDDDLELEINNEDFDNFNFVSLSIWRDGNSEGMIELSLSDLVSALKGFEELKNKYE